LQKNIRHRTILVKPDPFLIVCMVVGHPSRDGIK
jgi:hypothetical protein